MEKEAPFNTPDRRHSPTGNVKTPEFSQVEVGRSIRDDVVQTLGLYLECSRWRTGASGARTYKAWRKSRH